jgi:hypothetical protein
VRKFKIGDLVAMNVDMCKAEFITAEMYGFILAEVTDIRHGTGDVLIQEFKSCSLNASAWQQNYNAKGIWWTSKYLRLVLGVDCAD